MQSYEQLGLFYLGKRFDLDTRTRTAAPLLYDSRDLLTHAVCVGMTGSGKTGLGIAVMEEAALDAIPVLAIDPKGDLANLLLTFPSLSPAEFRPWVNEQDAAAAGLTPESYAARQADAWRAGLAEWDQDAARINRLRTAATVRIFTPGSRAATPLALLSTLVPAPGAGDEEVAERVGATTDSLLALAGLPDISPHSPEHVLLASLLQHAWRAGRPADLPWLVQHVQKPPFDHVGVIDLDTFFPARDRQGLALRLNGLLAAPGFDVWLSGEPLDLSRLLYGPDGRPRIAIVSIAHLDEAERMLAVSLVLNEALGWTRRQSGTTSLRALIYMDEVAGYFPPVANPPAKRPLLTLLKQARAFGVGVMLSTQNPVDLDYKGLSNAGTWFLGKLQTERDKARVLDGLEGAARGTFDRIALDRTLSALGKRVFLLHNVHEREPVVFETRWTLSYLRGPLTRDELKRVAAHAGDLQPAGREQAGPAAHPRESRPIVPAGVREFFMPGASSGYVPRLYGSARVAYRDVKRGVDTSVDVHLTLPFGVGAIAVDWGDAAPTDVAPEALLPAPPSPESRFAPLPAAAADPRSYPSWERDFARWLAQARPLTLHASPGLALAARPGESERDFRIRVQQASHERRDEAVQRLRDKYAPKVARLTERIEKAREVVAREQQQVGQQKIQTAVSIGATVLGALVGRRALSASTLGRATTAARGVSRAAKEAEDVARAEARVTGVQESLRALQAEMQAEIDAVSRDLAEPPIESVSLKARRTDVDVRLVALVWVPSAP